MTKNILIVTSAIVVLTIQALGGGRARVLPVAPPEADGLSTPTEIQQINPSVYSIGPGDSIGYTVSDYATNGSACHNIINYADDGIAIGRMGALIADATDRGTYYSYSSDAGATWSPLAWIEGVRRGWGNIEQLELANGTEVTMSHDAATTPMDVCIDADRGLGVWSCNSTLGSGKLWPRLSTSQPFAIHTIHADANPATDLRYSRSQDGGATFDILDQPVFPGNPAFQADADAYDIASRGTNIAIIHAPSPTVAGTADVLLATSTDNGDTWSTQTILDVKGPGELPLGEEEYQPDGAVACVYDSAGNLHVTWTNFLAIGDGSNNPVLFYEIDAPVSYWSEATGVVQIPTTVHDTSIVKPGNAFGNLVTQPDIGFDANNNPYIIYQQQISEQDTAEIFLQHIYATGSPDGGATWTEPVDITPGTGFDASFGSLADFVDDNVYLTYFSDPLGGNAVRANHSFIQVAVMFHTWPAADLLTGVKAVTAGVPEAYRLEQNYPNPFNPATTIRYTIPAGGHTTLKVFDVLGREVSTLVDAEQDAGSYQVSFDAAALANGTYFYTLEAGSFKETKKMLLLK
jgi:hypothetical protein